MRSLKDAGDARGEQRAMKRPLALVCITMVFCAASPPAPGDSSPSARDIQAAIDARAAAMPGAAIVGTMISGDTATSFQAGSSGTSRPLDDRTLFEIGSVTKTFTAAVLAQLALAGRLKLTDPVGTYLPASVHVPSYDGTKVSLLSLATQHSGLPRLPSNLSGANYNDPYAAYTIADLYAFLNGYRLTRAPGSAYEYSNLGFGLLGLALTKATHQHYEAMVRAHIWQPLQMDGTTIALSQPDRARLAVGHDADGTAVGVWNFTDAMAGAGAIRSDARDMTAYLRCAMGRGPLGAVCTSAQAPRAQFEGHTIGLAWQTNTQSGFIDHGGDTAGYHALVMVNADRSKGVVLLSSGPEVADIGAYMLDAKYPLATVAQATAVPAADLNQYAASYQNAALDLKYRVYPQGRRLYAQIAGQPPAVIYPSRPDHYYYKVVQAYVEFVRENGNVVGVILTQGLQTIPIYRLDASGKPLTTSLAPNYPPVVTLDAATLQSYAGSYAIGDRPVYTVSDRDGRTFFQVAGQDAYEIFPSAKDAFYFKVVDAQVTFERNAAGAVTGLTLHQNGADIAAVKRP